MIGYLSGRPALPAALALAAMCFSGAGSAGEDHCSYFVAGQKNLYWGDLHTHSAYSLDAYAFGNRHGPKDLFAFGRGQQLTLEDGTTRVQLSRPLDFMAITDHAETFDVMYICSDPEFSDREYCQSIRAGSNPDKALSVFYDYLIPLISGDAPARSPLCQQPGVDCEDASDKQWQRVQHYANVANNACEFTAFIGNEWSATPNDRHWHRNLVFKSDAVTRNAIDYLRYPSVGALWGALEEQCHERDGCDVIAIPHNTNMSEGGSFDVERVDEVQNLRRARYERLIEVHQSKGNSECLPAYWDDAGSDCGFERYIPRRQTQLLENGELKRSDWDELRSGYARALLTKGLIAYRESGNKLNPLQLGMIGSTDNHEGTPGDVEELGWTGDAWDGSDNPVKRFTRMNYNPGGLVAVWAEENTRESLFAALKRREVYGTSGPRLTLRYNADWNQKGDPCSAAFAGQFDATMGGQLSEQQGGKPRFTVQVAKDQVDIQQIQIIKGTLLEGQPSEQVLSIMESSRGKKHACVSWVDDAFEPSQPAYWYARVLEEPTPRWSKQDCEQMNNCAEHPGADVLIQERAWSSPIWHLPR